VTPANHRPLASSAATVLDGPPRLLAAWYQTERADIGTHLQVHGPMPTSEPGDRAWADRLVEAVRAAGLTGRGGAGFPTASKLASVRAGTGHPVLAVNAMEGEPASSKDRTLLRAAPHLVLDGADLVARIIRAGEMVLCVADDRDDSAERLRTAIAERAATRSVSPGPRLVRPPGRYITGEESALVRWLGGGPARPQFRMTKARPLRMGRRAVLVQSAETLAHIALIARYGAQWFRRAGTPQAPGTCLVTVSGPLTTPGVREIEIGTPISRILEQAAPTATIGACVVGGYGGTWLRAGLLDTAYAPGPLAAVGAAMGAGVIAAIPASSCGVAETARVATYMANESAGQCGPCIFGLHAIAHDLLQLARGQGDRHAIKRLHHRLDAVQGRGACGHPDGAVRFIRSGLEVFGRDATDHAAHRPCAHWNRPPVLPVPRSAADALSSRP
jgi:NADH:ubiquinone oxidoreductase subunit F (NADH-binding)